MKIPIVFILATAAVALANNLRGDEPVAAVSSVVELAVENSIPDESEEIDPDSRDLTTYSYRTRTGTGSWGGSYTAARSSGRKRKSGTRTKTRSSGRSRKRTAARSSRRRSSGYKKTAARSRSSGRKKNTASSRKWGGGTRKYKTTRKYGTRYYKNRSSRNRSSNRRSRTRSDDCSTLLIVKSDSRRSTMTCAEDTAYEFRNDFDETVTATSDKQARDGDVVAIIDDDTDCEDLWDEIHKEVRNRHPDRTFYVYYGSRQKYYSYKKNRSSRRRSSNRSDRGDRDRSEKATRTRSEKTTRTRSERSESSSDSSSD